MSRKRRRQDTYSLPRKRVKIDADSRMRRQSKKTTNVILPNNNTSNNGKNTCKKSNGSTTQYCTKRHQRPMIRLLKVKQSKNNSESLNYSPFKELIAQGRVTHILRSCHAKAFATGEKNNNDNADSLYGIVDESLYSPSFTFGNGFEGSSMVPREVERRTDNDYDVRPTIISPTTVVDVELEEEGKNELQKDDTTTNTENDESVKINEDGDLISQQQVHDGDNEKDDVQLMPRSDATNNSPPMGSFEDSDEWHDARDEDVDRQNTPRDVNTKDMSTPRSTNSSCASTQTDIEELPGLTLISEHDSNCSGLPFHFMPGGPPSNQSSSYTPRGSTSFLSPFNSGNVIEARTINNACMLTNEYSPIRPRASKGPIMAPYPSSISIPRPSMPPQPVYHDPATMLPPFNFMSGDYSRQQCNSSDSYNDVYLEPNTSSVESSPRGSLASLVKCILRFAAEWLLSLIMARARYNDDTPNAPQSSPVVSSSSCDSVSNTRQTEPAKSQPRLCRKERTHSPRASTSQLRPSSSNRANNIEPLTQREQPSTTSECVKDDHHQVKIPKTIQPPTGWKNLFQPKEGEWKCKTCFYINPSEAMTCDSCTAIKNRPANETLKSCLRREKPNIHSTNNNVSDTGKTPSKARKENENNFNDESSIGNAEEEEESDQLELSSVDSFSSVHESNSEEESEASEDTADEEASEPSADDDEEDYDTDDDDDDATGDEDCSQNKRIKRIEEPLNSYPPTAPPPTVRKPKPTRQSSYELVSDLSHNDQTTTASTSSKRIKRDCTQEIDIARRTSDTMSEEDIPLSKKRSSDSDDIDLDDDLNQVNKMAREQQTEAMDDVSVQYSEMDVEGRLTRRTSDTMSEDFPDSRGFHTYT